MSSAVIRLYEIMLAAKKIPSASEYINGWRLIFNAKNINETWRKIGLMHDLVEVAAQESMEVSPNQKTNIDYWKNQISAALQNTTQGTQWQHFIARIDQHTIGYLSAQATISGLKINHSKIDKEKTNNAIRLLNESISEIYSSELEIGIKLCLIRRIRSLANSLDDYIITGDEAIFDEFKITAFDISSATKNKINIPAKSKIREGLAIVSDLMSTADGAIALSAPIIQMLENF
ncbi:MAG: hypothetical protein ABL934_13765 [Lysobacteraceae bacterium]